MSYEVDVVGVGEGTWAPGASVGFGIYWPGEIAPHQWYRLAPQLDANNSPETSVLIQSEGVYIDGNGTQNAWMGILNNGANYATFTINILSTPSHF